MVDFAKDYSSESLQRKARSESILHQCGIAVSTNLPPLKTADQVTMREPLDVARRAMILCIVAARAQEGGLSKEEAAHLIATRGLSNGVTPNERAFIANSQPTTEQRATFAARYEAAWALAWALDAVDSLDHPSHICDVTRLLTVTQRSATFVASAKLQDAQVIMDYLDITYRFHWAIRDAALKNQPPPAAMIPSVVRQRHYALNWLTRYLDQDWDNVSTDT